MRINPEGKPVELSYNEILNALHDDIKSDDSMPHIIKVAAMEQLEKLRTVIGPYSA